MSKFSNTWTDGSGNIVKSEFRPGDYHYAMYARSRVSGYTYQPYEARHGSEAWVRQANAGLASEARGNFEMRKCAGDFPESAEYAALYENGKAINAS